MSKIPVSDVFDAIEMMLRDKWGYIINQSGKIWTANDQAVVQDAMAQQYGSQWIGHHVTDCSGVMVYIWREHKQKTEHSSNAIARHEVGEIGTVAKPGYAAFKWRATGGPARWQDGKGDYYHIGIVGQDGKTVYEAQGTKVGFTTSRISKWTYFAPFIDVEYGEKKEEAVIMDQVMISTDKVNVRQSASKSAPRIDYANAGEIANVIGTSGDWYHLDFVDRKLKGWVYGNFVVPASITIPDGAVATPSDLGPIVIPGDNSVLISLTLAEAESLYVKLRAALGK